MTDNKNKTISKTHDTNMNNKPYRGMSLRISLQKLRLKLDFRLCPVFWAIEGMINYYCLRLQLNLTLYLRLNEHVILSL